MVIYFKTISLSPLDVEARVSRRFQFRGLNCFCDKNFSACAIKFLLCFGSVIESGQSYKALSMRLCMKVLISF